MLILRSIRELLENWRFKVESKKIEILCWLGDVTFFGDYEIEKLGLVKQKKFSLLPC